MSNQLAVNELSNEKIELIKRTICKGASSDELQLFIHQCNKTGLDPIARQIYAIQRTDNGKSTMQIQLSIDGQRIIAERSGKYAGQLGPFWCGEDGVWKDVWLEKTNPKAAKVGVLRHDWKEPKWAVANWDAYAQSYGFAWKKMPALMLAKCAESLALRASFPNDLSGMYTGEEMGNEVIEETKPNKGVIQYKELIEPTIEKVDVSDTHKQIAKEFNAEIVRDRIDWKIPGGAMKDVLLSSKEDSFWEIYLNNLEKNIKKEGFPEDKIYEAKDIIFNVKKWLGK